MIFDGFDTERLRPADGETGVAAGDLAPFAVDDAEKPNASGKRIGLHDIEVLRIGEAQNDARHPRAAALMGNEWQFHTRIPRHRAVGDTERKPARLGNAARFNQRLAVQQIAFNTDLPYWRTAQPA